MVSFQGFLESIKLLFGIKKVNKRIPVNETIKPTKDYDTSIFEPKPAEIKVFDVLKTITEVTEANTRVNTEAIPELVLEVPQVAAEVPEVVLEVVPEVPEVVPEVVVEVPQVAAEVTEVVLEVVPEVPEVVLEVVPEVPEVVPEVPEVALEMIPEVVPEVVPEVPEVALEMIPEVDEVVAEVVAELVAEVAEIPEVVRMVPNDAMYDLSAELTVPSEYSLPDFDIPIIHSPKLGIPPSEEWPTYSEESSSIHSEAD